MIKTTSLMFTLTSSVLAITAIHSVQAADDADAEAKTIAAALAKLPASDRAEADAQRWCAVMKDSRLGSMGTPVKVSINGKSVFLCCAGCKAKAAKNGAETLAKAAESKKVNTALAKLSVDDRKAAETQRYCGVMEESRLGSMGAPIKVIVEGQPVFLCCKGCTKCALADPKATIARVVELKKSTGDPE